MGGVIEWHVLCAFALRIGVQQFDGNAGALYGKRITNVCTNTLYLMRNRVFTGTAHWYTACSTEQCGLVLITLSSKGLTCEQRQQTAKQPKTVINQPLKYATAATIATKQNKKPNPPPSVAVAHGNTHSPL